MLNYKINPNNKVQKLQIKHSNIFKGGRIHSSKNIDLLCCYGPATGCGSVPSHSPMAAWKIPECQQFLRPFNHATFKVI